MATYFKAVNDIFWSPSFWLPEGFVWKDLEPKNSEIYYPRIQDVNWCVVIGALLLGVRYVFERVIVVPLARSLGVKETKRPVVPHPVLESSFNKHNGKLDDHNLKVLTKQTDLSEREIQRWFHRRKFKDVPSHMQKFRECSWHTLFYLSAFLGGLYVMWDKDWFWKSKYCFINWPYQHVGNDLFIFYMAELSFYWSLLFSSLHDIKRKDFWEMTIHHVITINLIYWSWVINFVRIGALIIIVHDASDYWMVMAKMAKYLKLQTLCEFLFFMFVVVWTVTRLGLYPYWVLYASLVEVHEYVKPFQVHRIFVVLLCSLQVLHIVWTYYIYRVAFQKFTVGSIERDVRSDTEDDDDDNVPELRDVTQHEQQSVMNGVTSTRLRQPHDTNNSAKM